MNVSLPAVGPYRIGMFAAAVLVGASLGTLASSGSVSLPVVGSVSSLLAGGVGLVVGGGLYASIKRLAPGCGCSGDCGC